MDTGEKLSQEQVIAHFKLLSRPEHKGGLVDWAAIAPDQRVLLHAISETMPCLLMNHYRLDVVAFFEQATELPSAQMGENQSLDQAALVLETKLAESQGLMGSLAMGQPELAAMVIDNLRELADITRD